MSLVDYLRFTWISVSRHKFRSSMIIVAIAFALSSVISLTALGEAAKYYVLNQFAYLGSDTLIMYPGRNETTGGMPPITGVAARDITLDNIYFLQRKLSTINAVAPLIIGSAEISSDSRARETLLIGTTHTFIDIQKMTLSQGRNLIINDIRRADGQCLIGETLRKELFSTNQVIGENLRIADYRCRIVGELQGRGDAFGMDLSDSVIIPVASAQRVFNIEGLFRVLIQIKANANLEQTKRQILATMTELHQGEQDVTLVSPDAILSTFNDIISALTLAIGAIASISLLVAGLLIMNITLISIGQRTREIGLLKALGASARQIMTLFLLESALTSSMGACLGLLISLVFITAANGIVPSTEFTVPLWVFFAAVFTALATSLIFSWVPAKRASRLAAVVAIQKV